MDEKNVMNVTCSHEESDKVRGFRQGVRFGMRYGKHITKRYFKNYLEKFPSNHDADLRSSTAVLIITCSCCHKNIAPDDAWFTCPKCHGQYCLRCDSDVSESGLCRTCAEKYEPANGDPRTAILNSLLNDPEVSEDKKTEIRKVLNIEVPFGDIEAKVIAELEECVRLGRSDADAAESRAKYAISGLLLADGYSRIVELWRNIPRRY